MAQSLGLSCAAHSATKDAFTTALHSDSAGKDADAAFVSPLIQLSHPAIGTSGVKRSVGSKQSTGSMDACGLLFNLIQA